MSLPQCSNAVVTRAPIELPGGGSLALHTVFIVIVLPTQYDGDGRRI